MMEDLRNSKGLAARVERALAAIAGDLSLLVSLYTARVMVWLALRRRETDRAKAHAARRGADSSNGRTASGVWTKTGDVRRPLAHDD
jgi:hypothetical protein